MGSAMRYFVKYFSEDILDYFLFLPYYIKGAGPTYTSALTINTSYDKVFLKIQQRAFSTRVFVSF